MYMDNLEFPNTDELSVDIEILIIQQFILNDSFAAKVYSYIKKEHFDDKINQTIYDIAKTFFLKERSAITKDLLSVELNKKIFSESEIQLLNTKLKTIFNGKSLGIMQWLIDKSEEWCTDRSMYLAMVEAVKVYENGNNALTKEAIPELLMEVLAIDFNVSKGRSWKDNIDERFKYYTNSESRLPFKLDILNNITNGGLINKTLNMIIAGIYVGKTMILSSLSCDYARLGYNVLYVTLEISELEIEKRLDVNFFNIPLSKLDNVDKQLFYYQANKVKDEIPGDIIVCEYPTSGATAIDIESLLDNLYYQRQWKPDVLMIDYIGILGSSRKSSNNSNGFYYYKGVSEDIRAIAQKREIRIWSAMQLNRSGMGSDDVELTDIAESIAIASVSDLVFAATRSDEGDNNNRMSIKQLKNRHKGISANERRFDIGMDFEHQRILNVIEFGENTEDVRTTQITNRVAVEDIIF